MSRAEIETSDPVVEETSDLVQLVDQVAEAHTRIVVTRDGEPKAVLVSMDDYARLRQETQAAKPDEKLSPEEWFARSRQLREEILARRGGEPIEREVVDRAWREAREELEERDSYRAGLGR